MPTSTPLVHYASLAPSARKPALKRRRLNHATDPGCQPGRALTDNSNVGPTPSSTPALYLCAKLSCSTCHRALSTAIRAGVAGPSLCSRCVVFLLPPRPSCALALPQYCGIDEMEVMTFQPVAVCRPGALTTARTDAPPRRARSALVRVHHTPAPRPCRLRPPSRGRHPRLRRPPRPSLPSALRSGSATPR